MYLTGFADEAADSIEGQINVTAELGWRNIEARSINGTNIHDISDPDFDSVADKLEDAGIKINCFGSAIANWSKHINEPFDSSLAEARRAIPRMERLGAKLIRIMSFALLKDRPPDDQMEEERFRRLRELVKMFADVGVTAVHENCMNYGGMSWKHTLKMLENVPGLKLAFDTGNPIFTDDRTKPQPHPKQSPWEFYEHVKEHIAYVHIKDGRFDEQSQKPTFTYPGEGVGSVPEIVKDLLAHGYDGGFSIEPHMAIVHHDPTDPASDERRIANYLEYGRRMENIIKQAQTQISPKP